MARKHTSPTSKHQKVKEQRAKRKRQQRILTVVIITVLALAVVGVIVYPSLKEALTPAGAIVSHNPLPASPGGWFCNGRSQRTGENRELIRISNVPSVPGLPCRQNH